MARSVRVLGAAAVIAAAGLLGPGTADAAVYGQAYAASPSGTAHPVDGTVYAMARVGDRVILGGSFTKMRTKGGSSVSIHGLASVSASTGELDQSWKPQPSGTVYALQTDGSTLWVGGSFTIGSPSHTNLAAVSSAGTVLGFSANATGGAVRALALTGSTLYLGGDFTKIGTATRTRLGAVNTSGTVLPWAPSANNGVYALVVIPGGDVVAGGTFTSASGSARKYIARISSGGALTDKVFDLGTTCATSTSKPCYTWGLAADSTRVYSATAGPGGRAMSWDFSGKRMWSVVGDGDAQAVAVSSGAVYIGGHFNPTWGQAGSVPAMHSGIVVLSASSGAVSTYSPLVIGHLAVRSILVDAGALRLGGEFSTAGGAGQVGYASFPQSSNDGSQPTTPSGISLGSVTASKVTVNWGGASDNKAVTAYRLYRSDPDVANGVVKVWVLSSSSAHSYTDTTVVGHDRYSYRVAAVDANANVSAPTASVIATTPG